METRTTTEHTAAVESSRKSFNAYFFAELAPLAKSLGVRPEHMPAVQAVAWKLWRKQNETIHDPVSNQP